MQELVDFIKVRMQELERLSRSMSVVDTPSIQAAVDQLERLTNSVNEVVEFVQYHSSSPLSLPILKKIANNWAYHPDFQESWKSNNERVT